mgnify:CR=1 FL=1
MGIVDDIKEGVDDVKEGAGDVVDEVKEGDLGGAVDEAKDTVEDVASGKKDTGSNPDKGGSGGSGGGNKGSGGNPVNNAIEGAKNTVENATGLDIDGDGSTGKPEESKGPKKKKNKPKKKEGKPETQGQDKAPETQEQLRQFLGLGKQKTKDAGKKLQKYVNESEARDKDIINDDFARTGGNLFETGPERELSQAKGFKGESFNSKAFNNSLRAEQFFTGQDRIERARDTINDLNNQIETVRNSDASEFVIDTNGPAEGGKKTVSKSEAIETLQNDKNSLEKDVETISKNQLKRIQNIGTVNKQIEKDRNTITKKEASNIAKNMDLSEKGIDLTFFGKKFGKAKGGVAEASIIFDTALSSKSGELLGASVDQFIGSDKGDKTVEQVAEEQAIRQGQTLEKKGFKPVDEAVDTLTSIPGIIGTSVVGGAAFSGGSKALASLPKIGSQAQKVYQGAGALAGAYTVGKQGQKTKQQLDAGNEAKAVGTVAETGAGLFGFYKGQQKFNTYLGARTGTTRINQKNLLRKTGKDSAQGFGRFEGRTVIEKPTVRDYVDSAFGKGFRPKTETLETTGRYRIPTASEGSSQAKGQIRFNYPSGSSKTQGFEVLSNVRQTGNTRSGNKFRISSDNIRFRSEGRLFRNFRDQKEVTKSIQQGKTSSSAQEVTNNFQNVPVSKDSFIQKVELTGTNSKSNTFSDTTNFIVGRGSSSGGTAGGSGQGLRTGTKPGCAGSTNVRVRDVVNSEAQSYTNSLNPGKVPSPGSSSTVSGSNTQAKQGGSTGKQAGNQAETFNAGLSGSRLQNFRQNVYGSPSVQAKETGGQQQTRDGGTQITSRTGGSSTGTTEVTSTASNIIQDKKDRLGLNDSQKTGQNLEQGQRPKVGTRIRNKLGQGVQQKDKIGLEQTGKVGQGLEITNTTRTTTTPLQVLKTRQLQKPQQKLTSIQGLEPVNTTSTTARPKPGIGGIPTLELGQGKNLGASSPPGTGPNNVSEAGIRTDWFSANLVEQETGEQARFDISQSPRNSLTGLKTVQERRGEVESPKILENSNNGGNEIW